MYKIGIIGDAASVSAYRAIGFSVFEAGHAEEAAEMLKTAVKSGEYAVIFVTEKTAELIESDIAKYKDLPLPAIVSVPGRDGSTGYGKAAMRDATIRAVGSDIGGE